jgi:hypothetical protein
MIKKREQEKGQQERLSYTEVQEKGLNGRG